MPEVVLIQKSEQNPLFSINIEQASDVLKPKSLRERVQDKAKDFFIYLKIIGRSCSEAFMTNARYSWSTFRYIVLRYDGNNIRIPETGTQWMVRGGIWLVAHTIGFVALSIFHIMKNVRALPAYLMQFAPQEINLLHLVAKKTSIDVSHVPANIQVSTLLNLYDQINFTNKDAPGYMPELARLEARKTFSVAELRQHLNVFVNNVNGRVPFLGTPPAYLAPQLMKFYKKIEDAVRYSVHKVVKDYDDFMRTHGNVAPQPGWDSDYHNYEKLLKVESAARQEYESFAGRVNVDERKLSELQTKKEKAKEEIDTFVKARGGKPPKGPSEDYKKYCGLLEDKARVAIDMAIAGAHCGARYMGDAIDTYLSKQDPNSSIELQTMQGRLWMLLGKKREKIARSDIQQHMGQDTHSFSAYMANMGELLGIPGTEDTVEYLGGSLFDRQKYLRLFFQKYTPEVVRSTIQDEIKKSATFREAIFDWLKDRVGNWKKKEYQAKIDEVLESAKAAKSKESKYPEQITLFARLIEELNAKGAYNKLLADDSPFPNLEKWDDYYDALFGCPDAKSFFQEQFKSLGNPVAIIQAKQQVKIALSKPQFKQSIQDIVTGKEDAIESFKKTAAIFDQVQAVNQVLAESEYPTIDEDVLYRCFTQKNPLKPIVQDHIDQLRRAEFLDALTRKSEDEEPAKTIEREGLKKPVLDWILYSQHILHPKRENR